MSSTSPTLPSILDRDPASLTSDECLDAAVELAKSGFYLQFRNFVEFTTLNFDTLTFAQKKDSLEMLNRVSGLAKRQEAPKETERFIININTGVTGAPQVSIVAETVEPQQADMLASVRAAARSLAPDAEDIDFSEAPEF